MMTPKYDGIVTILITFGILIGVSIWGFWELVDWLFIDDSIRVTKPLIPKLELIIVDNVIDTIYVYQKP